MSEIKLVVTDIDGTLVMDRAHDATPAAHQAMRAVQAAGVVVAAATARPHEMAQELFEKLGFKGPCIFDGGASIRDVETGKLLWSNWLSAERMRAIAQVLLPHAEVVDFFPDFRTKGVSEFSMDDIVEPAPYGFAMVRRTKLPAIIEALTGADSLNVHMTGDWAEMPDHTGIQVTDINSDKFHGVTGLQKLLGVSVEQTLAIGDGGNDIPLLKAAGVRVAMGNAKPELKAIANHQVAPVEQDGWAEAMHTYVLA